VGDILLVEEYVDAIVFGASNYNMCEQFFFNRVGGF